MKKLAVIFLILMALIVGMNIGGNNTENKAAIIQEQIDEFEENITEPNNEYYNSDNYAIGINNKIAKAGGNALSKAFEFSFDLLEKIIN